MEIPATDPQGSPTEQLHSARNRADALRDELQRERESRRKADAAHAEHLKANFLDLARAQSALSPSPRQLADGFCAADRALTALCKAVRCAAVDDALFPAHVETALLDALRVFRGANERARVARVFATDVD